VITAAAGTTLARLPESLPSARLRLRFFVFNKKRAVRWCLAALLPATAAVSQQGRKDEATGTLTVTATVAGSERLILSPDGELTVVVANAPDATFLAQQALAPPRSRSADSPSAGKTPEKPSQQPGQSRGSFAGWRF